MTYAVCGHCGSLQTERPYWLEESYAGGNLATLDTGAGQRVLNNWALTLFTARILGARRLLDFGGGDGLLCRLLRDSGLDAWTTDRFAKATYGIGFQQEPAGPVDLLTAFEVVEHLANPEADLPGLLATAPQAFLGTTCFYTGQGADWWYLTPETGQHVFFYSPKGLEIIAERFGYSVFYQKDMFLFTRTPLTAWQRLRLRLLFNPRSLKLLRCLIPLLPTPGIQSDLMTARQVIDSRS
ncbi:class I SAM-dependent methyltransferase [Niveispirillum irakense]|uniref:class I SAM-dependent methyltransferase n=1 Tax=Niveispirillum irakense TaxID=34011 RepID=UPI00048ADBE4|nr:class I SAM-dependent methyltransferase [Niveispirillum irakense]